VKVLIIITASIAIKKSMEVVKILKDKNVFVDCILTDKAKN
jgi:phosphopantothenoylcysteine synthetase/decarboxylase